MTTPLEVTNECVTQLEAEVTALKRQILALMARQTQLDALVDAAALGALWPSTSSG